MLSESEIVKAQKPGTDKSTDVEFEKKPDGKIVGGAEDKYRVKANIESRSGDRKRSIDMIRREVEFVRDANGFCAYWKILIENGIPTIPTVRKIGDNEVLVTDLTADGSVFYGKESIFSAYTRWETGKMTRTDNLFLEIDPENMQNEVNLIVQKATDNKIALPGDDPFDLLVHPNGKWKLLVIDLVPSTPDDLKSHNEACGSKYMEFYMLNRDSLEGKNPPDMIGV